MGVILRRPERSVSEEFLDRAEIGSTFEQMSREGVTQGVGVNRWKICPQGCSPNNPPQNLRANVKYPAALTIT